MAINKAILKVMEAVNYLQKDKVVGSGSASYKSVTGAKVRAAIRSAMIKEGLTITTQNIEFTEEVSNWEESNQYGTKRKQQVRITAKVDYLLEHTSGQSRTLQGLGTGVDSQDKAPGKALSYALKYTLLNLFVVPTGLDPDEIHSEEIEIKPAPKKPEAPKAPKKVTAEKFKTLEAWVVEDPSRYARALIEYSLTEKQIKSLEEAVKKVTS